ncbi:MAG: hypothetical protein WC248_06055 [Candidatus Methanomethylophilaceae archaeon]|jgi:hypothetical protein
MELKIKIKEVKEEVKPLTIEEQCMHSVITNPMFKDAYRDEVRRHLDEIGFVKPIYDGNVTGLFRKETTRDATDNEIRAWHCLRMVELCVDSCAGCIKNRNNISCNVFSDERSAKELLFNKEVILGLV